MSSYADIIKKCQKEWDCPDLMEIGNAGKKIPFSSPSLNWATYGGIPRNAITEFHGVYGGGKSTSALDICKNAIDLFNTEYEEEIMSLQNMISEGKKEYKSQLQDLLDRGPKKVLYLDLEHSFDKKWANTLGISEELEIMQPPNVPAEQILQKVQEIVESGEMGLIVLDSIPSLVTEAELSKKFGERTVASQAGLMTIFCRKIVPILTRYQCTMIFINQIRINMNNPYADSTPGGEAIKFYSSLRLSFKLGNPVDFLGNDLPQKAENPAGYLINVKIVKQKSAPFDRKLATYYLMSQSGLRTDFEYVNLALKQYDIIRKAGAWFTICDPYTKEPLEVNDNIVKVNGLSKVYDYVQANPEYYKRLCDFIVEDINNNGLHIQDPDGDSEEE